MAHDPSSAEKRREARARGGTNKSRTARAQKLLPEDLQVMDEVLSNAIAAVYRGTLSPGQGSALAALAGARVRLREIGLKMAEQAELRDRLAQLEDKINELGVRNRQNGKTDWRYR